MTQSATPVSAWRITKAAARKRRFVAQNCGATRFSTTVTSALRQGISFSAMVSCRVMRFSSCVAALDLLGFSLAPPLEPVYIAAPRGLPGSFDLTRACPGGVPLCLLAIGGPLGGMGDEDADAGHDSYLVVRLSCLEAGHRIVQ